MKHRFPNAKFRLPEKASDQWAVAYAYLQRALKFREAFDRLEEPLVFHAKNGPTKVACFGVREFEGQPRTPRGPWQTVTVLARAATMISSCGSIRPPKTTR